MGDLDKLSQDNEKLKYNCEQLILKECEKINGENELFKNKLEKSKKDDA